MLAGTVAAQVKVVLVLLGIHAQVLDAGLEQIQALLALGAADNLADTGNQAVGGGDGLAVLVHAHVECLDLSRVVGHEGRALKVLLGQEAFVLGLQVDAPAHGVVELVAVGDCLLQDLDGLGVGNAGKVGVGDMVQALEQTLVHKLVEHIELVGAGGHNVLKDVLEHGLGVVHVVVKVGKGHLGLDHPKLGGVARGVGVLGTEGGAKGVHVTKGHGKVLGIELAGHGEACMLAKEVLAPVDLAGLGEGRIFGVERGHAEHLAGALAVTRGDDGGVDVDKALLLEEAVDGGSRDRANAEHGAEQVGARAQVLLGAQELDGCALLLQRVIRGARALDLDGSGRNLERLGRIGGQLDGAGANECGRDVLMGDLVVVVECLAVHDDLQVAEAAAVVERNKAKVLHVADGLDPAGDGDGLAAERLGIGIELRDFGAVHVSSHNG